MLTSHLHLVPHVYLEKCVVRMRRCLGTLYIFQVADLGTSGVKPPDSATRVPLFRRH
jgi:hypothetical protein